MNKQFNVALIGNPNTGKSTLFNALTGLNQKIGNYPGVTVDKKTGTLQIQGESFEILDLPGTYSLFPNSEDEIIAHRVLNNPELEKRPDYVLLVIDSTKLQQLPLSYPLDTSTIQVFGNPGNPNYPHLWEKISKLDIVHTYRKANPNAPVTVMKLITTSYNPELGFSVPSTKHLIFLVR